MDVRDKFLALAKAPRKIVAVEIPEWDLTVHVKVMNGLERDKFEAQAIKDGRRINRALYVVYTACDEDGKSIFTEKDLDDLGNLPASGLDRIIEAATSINDISSKAVEEAGEDSPTSL